MKPKRTWILVADAGRARILESEGNGLTTLPGLTFHNELPPTHELVDDRQTRSYESVGHARHAISGKTDPRREEKRSFAEELACMLEGKLAEKAFDRLVIVAPPQALGDLRKAMPAAVKEAIVSEVAKDLTKAPDAEIVGHLELPFKL